MRQPPQDPRPVVMVMTVIVPVSGLVVAVLMVVTRITVMIVMTIGGAR